MQLYKKGDRVELLTLALRLAYVNKRKAYTNMYLGKKGTVIGYASTGKVAIEFDDIVFTQSQTHLSSQDNGCHGKGKLHHCWYLPEDVIKLIDKEEIFEEDYINNPLILLL